MLPTSQDHCAAFCSYENAGTLYWKNSAGCPVRRSIRFAIGGWVEKRPLTLTPSSGWIMNKCAVEGDATMGMRREYASNFRKALARAYGLPV
jgi:hypothetical protein